MSIYWGNGCINIVYYYLSEIIVNIPCYKIKKVHNLALDMNWNSCIVRKLYIRILKIFVALLKIVIVFRLKMSKHR